MWHTLRREMAGAWRSVRYDLDSHRAAKLAGAFTEEFEPSTHTGSGPSRLVPLTGVALLLAGGAAGAVLAINGGLSALGTDSPPPLADRPAAAATAGAAQQTAQAAAPVQPSRPGTPPRPDSRRSTPPPSPPFEVGTPTAAPIVEGTDAPPSATPTPTGSAGSPTGSPSVSASGERSQSGAPGTGR
jgi:hypothetical protein